MPLPGNVRKAVDAVIAAGDIATSEGRHTAQDQLLWMACESVLPADLWAELQRLRVAEYPRRRRDEDAAY